jgi:hypothetical protein
MPFHAFPPTPAAPGIEFAGRTEPFHGETANGDGLFFETGRVDGSLLVLLVDITHHGPGTSVTMDTIRAALGEPAAENRGPAGLLGWLHSALAPQWDATGNFAAAIAVLVSAPDKGVTAANAAQPSPYLRFPGADCREWNWPGNPPLGIPDIDMGLADVSMAFPVGAAFLGFTDGVSEGGAKSGVAQFQRGGLAALLGGLPAGATPAEVVQRLETALRAHVGPSWPDDDTTLFCVRHRSSA